MAHFKMLNNYANMDKSLEVNLSKKFRIYIIK